LDYPQRVAAARKLKLPGSVQVVPQIGHDAALTTLSFHPQDQNLLAALDDSPSLYLWHVEYGDTLLIAPLPQGRYDAIRWTDEFGVAVRRVEEDPTQQALWLRYDLNQPARWRPSDEAPAPWPTPAPAPFATVHPSAGPCILFPDGRGQRLEITRRPLGMLADPLGRYAIDWDSAGVSVYSAVHGKRLGRFDSQGVSAVAIDPKGGFVILTTSSGEVVYFDPVRPEGMRRLARLTPGLRCVAISPDSRRVALGSADHSVVVLDTRDGQSVMRSGRAPYGFIQEVILREQIGFAALRGETLSAYLDEHEQFIHTLAMPSACEAIAPSPQGNAIFAALRSGLVVEIDLRKRLVSTAFDCDGPPLCRLDVSTPDRVFAGLNHLGELLTHHGNKLIRYDLGDAPIDPQEVTQLAVASSGAAPAFVAVALRDGRVQVRKLTVTQRVAKLVLDVPCGALAIAFVPYRNTTSLALIDGNLVLWRLNLSKGALRRVGMLEAPNGYLPLGRPLVATADRDGSLRALFVTHNHHRQLLLIDPATATTHFMQGWVSVGQQVSSVYDAAGHWLRDPDTATIRMVSYLYPHSAEEWSRAPQQDPEDAPL
jgi:hypothetical protein